MRYVPGDIARLETCGIPAAIGLLVEVERLIEPHAVLGPMWCCKNVSGAPSDRGYAMPGDRSAIPDAWLRPIRPDDDDEQVLRGAGLPEPESIAHA